MSSKRSQTLNRDERKAKFDKDDKMILKQEEIKRQCRKLEISNMQTYNCTIIKIENGKLL